MVFPPTSLCQRLWSDGLQPRLGACSAITKDVVSAASAGLLSPKAYGCHLVILSQVFLSNLRDPANPRNHPSWRLAQPPLPPFPSPSNAAEARKVTLGGSSSTPCSLPQVSQKENHPRDGTVCPDNDQASPSYQSKMNIRLVLRSRCENEQVGGGCAGRTYLCA